MFIIGNNGGIAKNYDYNYGFTLIELSIVLIIIGLLTGGILLGKDLIKAAEIRSQITQIEQFNTAANIFRVKYGYLPGDIPEPHASGFGFSARGAFAGEGDGNGVLEGVESDASGQNKGYCQSGENLMFWVDLNMANLIKNSLTAATPTFMPPAFTTLSSTYFPEAKISPNFIYIYNYINKHYIGLANGSFSTHFDVNANNTPNISPADAFAIDNKIDDGLPQQGAVTVRITQDVANPVQRAAWKSAYFGTCVSFDANGLKPCLFATAASSTSCYDNGNIAGIIQQYTLSVNGGSGKNCALSFKAQF